MQIERQQTLVAIVRLEPPRRTVRRGVAPITQIVAFRRLDFQNLGTEIGQDPSGRRTRNEAAELEDADSSQGCTRHKSED